MDTKQSFKYGFLRRCAEEGLTAAEAERRAELAMAMAEKQADGGLLDSASGLWNAAIQSQLVLPGMAGVAAGGLAGGLAASATGPSGDVEESLKQRELTNLYDFYTDQLRRRNLQTKARRTPGPRVTWSA